MNSQFNDFDFTYLKKYKEINNNDIKKIEKKIDDKINNKNGFILVKLPNDSNNKVIESYNLIKSDKVFKTQYSNLNDKWDRILNDNNAVKEVLTPDDENDKPKMVIKDEENKIINRFSKKRTTNDKSCHYCLGNHLKFRCPSNNICYLCGVTGHKKESCKVKFKTECKRCKKKSHSSNNCNFLLMEELYYNDNHYNDLKNVICLNCNELGHINCSNYEKILNSNRKIKKKKKRYN